MKTLILRPFNRTFFKRFAWCWWISLLLMGCGQEGGLNSEGGDEVDPDYEKTTRTRDTGRRSREGRDNGQKVGTEASTRKQFKSIVESPKKLKEVLEKYPHLANPGEEDNNNRALIAHALDGLSNAIVEKNDKARKDYIESIKSLVSNPNYKPKSAKGYANLYLNIQGKIFYEALENKSVDSTPLHELLDLIQKKEGFDINYKVKDPDGEDSILYSSSMQLKSKDPEVRKSALKLYETVLDKTEFDINQKNKFDTPPQLPFMELR